MRLALYFAVLAALLTCFGYAGERPEWQTVSFSTTWLPSTTRININNISTVQSNDGWADRDRSTGNSGLFFPKNFGRTAVFQSGLVWGAKKLDSLHVGGGTYVLGLQPGKILSPGHAEDPNLPKNRIYRVRPDYLTADLTTEAREDYTTQEQVRWQYTLDWSEWPATDGAPFIDKNSNGTYEPNIDVPGIRGASQTVWFVANDLDTTRVGALYGTYPLGLEMQLTLWSYADVGALSNVIYKRYLLMNKSTAPFDSMYVCQWSDPDVGDYSDDLVGCDTTLDLTYGYNSSPLDNMYTPLTPPAVGYQIVNRRATSAFYFAAGGTYSDPPFSSEGAIQWYNLLRGLTPLEGADFIHPNFPGQPTKFWLDGDPFTGIGRIDGAFDSPGDRRMGINIGPFQMGIGDTQEVVIAVVAGMGQTYLQSVNTIRSNARVAKSSYDVILSSVPPVIRTGVSYPNGSQASIRIIANCEGAGAQFVATSLLRNDGSPVSSVQLFDDGVHWDSSANDGIWGNTIVVNREAAGMYLNASVTDSSSSVFLWEHIREDITTAGSVVLENPYVFSDNLNSNGQVNPGENIRYGFTITNMTPFDLSILDVSPLTNDFKFIWLGPLGAGGSDSLVYNPNDPVTYFEFSSPDSGEVVIPFSIADANNNRWTDTLRFQVVPFPAPVYGSPVNHIAGATEWLFNVMVIDPQATNNHTYEISVVDSTDSAYTKAINLRDVNTGGFLFEAHELPDQYGHNMPVTNGFKVMRGANFGAVGLRQDSTQWISSSTRWLQGDRFTFDPQFAFNGGVTTGAMLPIYLGAVQSNYDPYMSYPVEIRFDVNAPQNAYRLRRIGSYLIHSFSVLPFSAWDVRDRTNARQLTVAWRDQNNSSTWDPVEGSDGTEIVFVYNKTYDPTGSTQFSMPPNAIPNECTIGAGADIMYGLSLAVRPGHSLNENPGTLYLRPNLALTSADRFTFNPTVVLGVQESEVPALFGLLQNYPNPFNPLTTIEYQIPIASRVTINIYNILGQHVKTLVDGIEDAGFKSVRWNATGVASGVYYYRMEAGEFIQVKKLLLLR